MSKRPLCDFRSDGQCRRCGRRVQSDPAKTHAVCRVRCEHLGEAVAGVKVDCRCAEGEKLAAAHVCRRHGRCLPHYRPDAEMRRLWSLRHPEASIYHLCHGCESFRPAQESAPADIAAQG